MNRKKIVLSLVTVLAVLAIAGSGYVGAAFARASMAAPIPTMMSYQGYLTDNVGNPINGTPDFDFRIWDNSSGGTQVWSEIQTNMPVTNGYFSVMLGAVNPLQTSHFGGPRYLEVRVDTGSGYVILPRQLLSAAPYAYQADQAQAVPWSGITTRPPGLDDGDDNTQYTAGKGLILVGNQFNAQGSPYQQVIVVAQSGGDFTNIQAALDSIAPTSDNRYLIWIAPGAYSERVTMKPFVDLMGAGEGNTIIAAPGSPAAGVATVTGASDAMLSQLTIQATGDVYATAVANIDANPTLRHVSILVENAASEAAGIYNMGAAGSSPILEDVTIRVSLSSASSSAMYGMRNQAGSHPSLHNVSISVFDGEIGYGIHNADSSGVDISDSVITVVNVYVAKGIQANAPTVNLVDNVNMEIQATNNATGIDAFNAVMQIHNLHLNVNADDTATGITRRGAGAHEWFDSTVLINVGSTVGTSTGIHNEGDSTAGWGDLTLNRFEILVGGQLAVGIMSRDANLRVNRTRIDSHGSSSSAGIVNVLGSSSATPVFSVTESVIQAGTTTVVDSYAMATIQIGGTHLAGGPVIGSSVVCAGVYDEAFAFFAGPACP